mmetsp:Transcript_11406/g.21784  ORF Transcript_11406/g.21784 Transcript_11406/m.21784 type:complete len:915 (+) Transcript_11406:67-2811(+)
MSSFDEEKALPGEGATETSVAAANEKQSRMAPNSKLKYLILGVILLVAAVVAITVPVVRNNDDSKDVNLLEDEKEIPEESDPLPSPNEEEFTGPNITTFSVFNPHIANFNEGILKGYESDDALAEGLGDALRALLDRVVARNIGTPGYENVAGGPMFAFTDGDAIFETTDTGAAPPAMDAASPDRSPVGDKVNDFGTNNQEQGVEEGDTVVANKDFLFAAYGDLIVVFNTTSGDQVATFALPPLEGEEYPPPDEVIIYEPPVVVEDPRGDPVEASSGQGSGVDEPFQTTDQKPPTRRRDSMWWYPRTASVQAMLLVESKLVVVANGYGMQYQYSSDHAIDSYLGTRVLAYDTTGLGSRTFGEAGELEPITMKDFSGYHVSMRAIDGNVHMVTSASIVYYDKLVFPFEKYNSKELSAMTDEEYISTVIERANDKYIPEFVRTFMDDVRVDGEVPKFAQINTWDDGTGASLAPLLYPDGYAQSIALVYSFSIESIGSLGKGEELTGVSSAGAILPAYGPTIYASEDTMIVATSGMGFSEKREAMVQKTYLMSFKLNGSASQPYTVGSVFGEILNQYSMDVVDGVLRMATTIRRAWFWGVRPLPEPMPIDEPVVDIPEDEFVPVEDEPVEMVRDGDETTVNFGGDDGGPDVWEESTTENYVMTIKIAGEDVDNNPDTPSVMQELDSVRIGKPDESITAVRFYDKYAYAVTFEQTDPFYKLDVSDATDIKILSEVSITGFSQYLHAVDTNEEVILAIGQEADENGRILGLTISVFDMRDNNSTKVARHSIELSTETWSSSEALWDKNAVRYNKATRLLIIPVNINSYTEDENFNGFKLFEVAEDYSAITEVQDCSVQINTNYDIQYYCGYLSPRALIFEGSMVTLKEHFVARTDLDTCLQEWDKTVAVSKNQTQHCFW